MTDSALHALGDDLRKMFGLFDSPSAHRERIATQIVAGILGDCSRQLKPEQAARHAVECADALLAELKREPVP